MKEVLFILLLISQYHYAQEFVPPNDWQVEGLKGKVKHMHISQEYYWKSASGETQYNPLPILVYKYFDDSGYLLYEEYNVVGPSSGRILWSKVLDFGRYEANRNDGSKVLRPFAPIIFKGKKEWSSTTEYQIVLKSETLKENSIIIVGKCDDKGRLLQRVERYYINGVVQEHDSIVTYLDYNDVGDVSSIERDSYRTKFSIPIKKSEVHIVDKDKYCNPLSIVYNKENSGKAVTVYQYEYYD